MNPLFLKLYGFAASVGQYPIKLQTHLVPEVKKLTGIDEIWFTAVELDPKKSLGHIKHYYFPDPGAAYGSEPHWIVDIRHHNDPVMMNWCHKRFVCCKELMHVFDSPAERVDSRRNSAD